jgi:hypothetical protein
MATPQEIAAEAALVLSTGTFAVQGTWSNDTGGCQVSHRL